MLKKKLKLKAKAKKVEAIKKVREAKAEAATNAVIEKSISKRIFILSLLATVSAMVAYLYFAGM